MNLKDLKSCIDQAFEKTDDGQVDVEVVLQEVEGDERLFGIKSVGQFGFVPDVVITIEE